MSSDVIALSLWLPLNGAWQADVHLITDAAPEEGTQIEFQLPGQAFQGRVRSSGLRADRVYARVIGGAVDWQQDVDAKHYRATTADRVLFDLGVATDAPIGISLPSFSRPVGTIGQAVQILARTINLNWRCNLDGTVRLRPEEPVPVSPGAIELHRDAARGIVDIAPERAVVLPGTTVGEDAVGDVLYVLEAGSALRCRYWTETRGAMLERYVRWATRDQLYLGTYPCTVVRQAADGTLDLTPDDGRVRGTGLQGIQIRHGLPGCSVRVPAGTRVRLAWDDGDPRKPYCCLWDGGAVTEVSIGGSAKVALASLVAAQLDDLKAAIAGWVPVPNDGGAALKTALSDFAGSSSDVASDILGTS